MISLCIRIPRCFVVDADPAVRDYFKSVMSSFGMQCDFAADGKIALALAEKAAKDKMPYDIVFADYLMENLSGIEIVRILIKYPVGFARK